MANEKRLIYAEDALEAEFSIEADGAIGFVVDSEVIRRLPTVDAVEVVRCKDCKYFGTPHGIPVCGCFYGLGLPDHSGDDFCSYGERKENETD